MEMDGSTEMYEDGWIEQGGLMMDGARRMMD